MLGAQRRRVVVKMGANWIRKANFAYYWAGPETIDMYAKVKYLGIHGLGHLVDEDAYTKAYQEEGLRRMMASGVNALFFTYSWGWPPRAEADGRRVARNFIKLCKKNNVRTLAYMQLSNYVWKAFHDEIPESKNWECTDKEGNPVPYMGVHRGRRYLCVNNDGWRSYLKGLMKEALKAGSDGVFFDNMVRPDHPGADCWCQVCRNRIRERLVSKGFNLSEEAILRRSLSYQDPVGREIYRLRVDSITDHIRALSAYARSVRADVVVTSNWALVDNFSWWGEEPKEIASLEDMILMESFTLARVRRGCIVNTVRAYKRAKCLAKGKRHVAVSYPVFAAEAPVYSAPTPVQLKLGIAEAAACVSSLVLPATERFTDKYTILTADEFEAQRTAAREYYSFVDANWDLYEGHESICNLGVFEPGYMKWASSQIYPYALGVEQTLIQSQIPFDIIDELDGNLEPYRALVLPNILLLSQVHCDKLKDYVERGGSLVLVGHPGIYTESYEYRGDYGVKEILGISYPHGTEIWAERKEARVVFLPSIDAKTSACDISCVEDGVLLPRGYQLLKNAVLWALHGTASVELGNLPHPYVFVEITGAEEKRAVVHLLNYKYFETLKNIKLTVRPGFDVQKASLVSPELGEQNLILKSVNEGVQTVIPELRIYDIVVLE